MPTLREYQATSTPFQEMEKCRILRSRIRKNYPATSSAKTTALSNLDTLITNWQSTYDTELAAATIDDFPASITTQVSSLQSTYTNYSSP